MTTTLKPGDIVQHPNYGFGIVYDWLGEPDVSVIYVARDRYYRRTSDLTGWERVEIVRPGHVQVRVDDLADDLESEWGAEDEVDYSDLRYRVAIRVAKAIAAQRAESTPPADEQDARWSMPAELSAKITATCKAKIDEKIADEQPTSTTVTLPRPDCGEAITRTAMVEVNREGERYLDFCVTDVHTCPPAQPDEPQEFGARVTVTRPDGSVEKWLRSDTGTNEAWRAENGDAIGWFSATTWANVTERGTVTIGWSVEHD